VAYIDRMKTPTVNGRGIFVDDGHPESDDYSSNYVAYDPMDAADYARAVAEARRRFCQTTGACPNPKCPGRSGGPCDGAGSGARSEGGSGAP